MTESDCLNPTYLEYLSNKLCESDSTIYSVPFQMLKPLYIQRVIRQLKTFSQMFAFCLFKPKVFERNLFLGASFPAFYRFGKVRKRITLLYRSLTFAKNAFFFVC